MPLPAHVLAEMAAGAEALAKHQGLRFDTAGMARLEDVADRHAALQRWEREGVLRMDNRLEFVEKTPGGEAKARLHIQHTILVTGEVIEEDAQTISHGGYPSELLIARIALALQACAGKEVGHG